MLPSAPSVLEPRQVQCPPQRLPRDADDRPRARERRDGVERRLGVVAGAPSPRSRRSARRASCGSAPAPRPAAALNSTSRPGRLRAAARLGDHLGGGIAAPHPQAAPRQAHGQLALAAADLVRLARAGSGRQRAPADSENPSTSRRSTGLAGPVLVVDVAARLAGGGRSRSDADLASVPLARPDLERRWPSARAATGAPRPWPRSGTARCPPRARASGLARRSAGRSRAVRRSRRRRPPARTSGPPPAPAPRRGSATGCARIVSPWRIAVGEERGPGGERGDARARRRRS